MVHKKKWWILLLIVILVDLIIVLASVILSTFPGNMAYWSFSVSDFIQLLVVEVALLGPMIIENWKKKQNQASIKLIDISPNKKSGEEHYKPYDEEFKIKIINSSTVLLKNCKVLLEEIIFIEDGMQEGNPKQSTKKPIYRYLRWHSLDKLSVTLNPSEPSSFILGQLIVDQVIRSGEFRYNQQFLKIIYFSEVSFETEPFEKINQSAILKIKIFSENADVYGLDIHLHWPKQVYSYEEFLDGFDLQIL